MAYWYLKMTGQKGKAMFDTNDWKAAVERTYTFEVAVKFKNGESLDCRAETLESARFFAEWWAIDEDVERAAYSFDGGWVTVKA